MNNAFKENKFISFLKKNYVFLIVLGVLVISIGLFFILKSKSSPDFGIKMVSGTEYISGEQGQVIVRLEDSRNNPINDANCMLSLLYPDKSFFLIDVQMIPTSVPGNYYHSFITPQTPGIYEEHIICEVVRKDVLKTLNISYSFHVSPGLNLILEISKSQREQYDDIVSKINNLSTDLNQQVNLIDIKVQDIQTFIDNNVMHEMQTINQNIYDINNSLNDSVAGIESRLHQTLLSNFGELYERFKKSYIAMSNIFGEDDD